MCMTERKRGEKKRGGISSEVTCLDMTGCMYDIENGPRSILTAGVLLFAKHKSCDCWAPGR